MSEEIKIEKGVPMPRRGGLTWNQRIPDLAKMKPGDSFFIPGATHTNISAVRMRAKSLRIPYACRTVTENGVKGIRVWRTA